MHAMLSLSDNDILAGAAASESSGFQTASARLAKVASMTALSSLHIVSTPRIIAFYQLTAVLSPQTRRSELVSSTSADACLCQPRRARAFLAPRSGRRGRASSAFRPAAFAFRVCFGHQKSLSSRLPNVVRIHLSCCMSRSSPSDTAYRPQSRWKCLGSLGTAMLGRR